MSQKIDFDQIAHQFKTDGYAIVENFVDASTLAVLKREMVNLVDKFDPSENLSVFTAGTAQSSDDYFLESGDKIRYFLEKDAVDPESGKLAVAKDRSLNKIGHALHWKNGPFRSFTFGEQFKQLAHTFGLVNPLVVQSMIIFKNPQIGGKVVEHQDASYLHTEPKPNGAVVGFWIPLEDATTENGCLEFVPGSHKTTPLPTRWVRTVQADGSVRMEHTSPDASYDSVGEFVKVPAKAGSCVIIDGLVVHRSAPNLSAFPRPIYTFHMFDQGSGMTWDKRNWLQPTDQLPFPSLYTN